MSRRQLSPAATVCIILLVPLAIPALFVLLVPSADTLRAQELGPKQSFEQPLRTSESLTNSGSAGRRAVNNAGARDKDAVSAAPQRPSGKMDFIPDSPAPKSKRPMVAARSAANAAVRKPAPGQPAKIAAARQKPQTAPRLKAPTIDTRPPTGPEPVTDPTDPAVEAIVEVEQLPARFAKPIVAVKKELTEDVNEFEPEAVADAPPDLPAEFSERPELPLPDFELPIARNTLRSANRLEVEILDDELPPPSSKRDIVNLYFEEEGSSEDSANEDLGLVDREPNDAMEFLDPASTSEIQSAVAQVEPDDSPATVPALAAGDEVQPPSAEILAELLPVRSIEIRKAVEVPKLAEMDDPKLHEPADQARAMLRKRPPFKFWPVYRDPWIANRDSFAFHHNPLWFEDPNLERCGRGWGHFTTVGSIVHFNTNIPFLPYRMTAEPSWSCVRTLPDCTVCQKFGHDAYLPPWSWRAAAVQAAAVTGFFYAIP